MPELSPFRSQRVFVWGLVTLLLAAALWVCLLFRLRQSLGLENHLVRNLALPFVPVGRPALLPDGRIFVVTAEGQLVSLGQTGQLLWNKLLPGLVLPQPVLVSSSLLVLQGAAGRLYGYSLGGELRFTAQDGGDLSTLPCADDQGNLYLLDAAGGLSSVDGQGRQRFHTSLGLFRDRQLILLPSGQLFGTGRGESVPPEVFLAERSGVISLRQRLSARVAGLSLSPLPNEAAALTSGSEVLTFTSTGAIARRLPLPSPARSAPLLTGDGAAYVLVQAAPSAAVLLCRVGPGPFCLDAVQDAPPPAEGLREGPLLGRDGRVYTAFSCSSALWPAYFGVLSVAPDGKAYRQALSARVPLHGLTLGWGGGVMAIAQGEPYLWLLEGGSDTLHTPYHPWPMPNGNPAGSSRPWPERP